MNDFIRKYQDQLHGTLSGFDRLVFRGTLWKDAQTGMKGYLWAHGLGARDFGGHAEEISRNPKEASLAPPVSADRPVRYWNSAKEDKQQIALKIAAHDGMVEGPICALTAVELCRSYAIQVNPRMHRPELARPASACFSTTTGCIPRWVYEHSAAKLASVPCAHLAQRSGVAGAANGSSRHWLSPSP